MTLRALLATLVLTLVPAAVAMPAPAVEAPSATFPRGFLWGAATAAHQVEGGLRNDWAPFEAAKGNVKNGDTSEVGVDGYHRYDADFALAADMGHNAHRLSIEWARLEPEPGRFDAEAIAHYHAVFASLRRHGLEPLVTLHHFTNPSWVAARGGWLSPGTVDDFARFARFCGREFGRDVDMWITINEPNVYASQSYQMGQWPPQHRDPEEAVAVLARLAEGHVAAYHALHDADRDDADGDGQAARVGWAQHIALYDPYAAWSPLDLAQAHYSDDVFNRSFMRAVTTGRFDFGVPGLRGVHRQVPHAASAVDFIGVNYYTRWLCATLGPRLRLPTPGAPTNAMGWEIYPEGLRRALHEAAEYAALPDGRHVPLYVTENGTDDRDGSRRSDYLVAHVAAVARAIGDGVDVRGYLHWTLMDNFEWSEGYGPKFGLYRVDRRPGADLARIATPAVAAFRAITRSNGLSEAVMNQYHKLPRPEPENR